MPNLICWMFDSLRLEIGSHWPSHPWWFFVAYRFFRKVLLKTDIFRRQDSHRHSQLYLNLDSTQVVFLSRNVAHNFNS